MPDWDPELNFNAMYWGMFFKNEQLMKMMQ